MQTIRTSREGIDYLAGILRETRQIITRVCLWKIPHHDAHEDISLKIGRYKRPAAGGGPASGEPETETPKSELTLDDEEFRSLLTFLSDNYEPFRAGERRYIPITGKFDAKSLEHVRGLFENPDTQGVVEFALRHRLVPSDVVTALEHRARQQAVAEFETMLDQDLVEHSWQTWFTKNDWVLGSDFVRILDEREIDTDNIADFLMEAYDGFLDVVEIKRPDGRLHFWAEQKDHDNYFPSSDLAKAITQATQYLYEVEQEANSQKFLERVGIKTIKPRATLIFGRSNDWNDEQRASYRLLSRSYRDLTILSYDHVLDRAKRVLAIKENERSREPSRLPAHPTPEEPVDDFPDDIPF